MSHNFEKMKALVVIYVLYLEITCAKFASIHLCAKQTGFITCKQGLISVQTAKFHRKSWRTCSTGERQTCSGADVTYFIRSKCDSRTSCRLSSTKRFLYISRDSCEDVTKYLEVQYICKIKYSELVWPVEICEGNSHYIKCNDGHRITFLTGSWERSSSNSCTKQIKQAIYRPCDNNHQNFLEAVKELCQDRQSCTIEATTRSIGQPCYLHRKYFKGSYKCVEGAPLIRPLPLISASFKRKRLCEGNIRLIRCMGNNIINILDATYGRSDPHVCTKRKRPDRNTKCHLKVTSHLRFFCQNKWYCVVYVDAGRYGDPCPGTTKYLEVKYKCEPKRKDVPSPGTIIPMAPTPRPLDLSDGIIEGTCGKIMASSSRIVNGRDAQPGSWPWQAAMYTSDGSFNCGASIISPFWLVTAAHCLIRKRSPWRHYVVLGDRDRSNLEGTEQKFRVSKIIIHKDYQSNSRHDKDIGLVKLNRPIMFNTYIAPVCLPKKDMSYENCYVTGWGRTKFLAHLSTMLQQAKVAVVSRDECRGKLSTAPGRPGETITKNMLCTDGGRSSACLGDSGGPLVCKGSNDRWMLAGVVSWGSPRCERNDMFTVYTNVKKMKNWIQRRINL